MELSVRNNRARRQSRVLRSIESERKPFRGDAPAHRRLATTLVVALLVPSIAGCSAHHTTRSASANAPALKGDINHPARAQGWVDTRLYFGLGPAEHPDQGISEARWRQFLDKEVTPRFPSGLSVIDIYGQWQDKNEPSPERLRSKLLIIDYADTQANRDKIDAIRAAWKQMTGDQSVLRVTVPADVSF